MAETKKVLISICICTFRRREMLRQLLQNLRYQETDEVFEYSLIVVDNDACGSARETVSEISQEIGKEIVYEIEPEQTIPAARNHALRLAKGNYIAIIDDDEFPPQNWLLTLYQAIRTFHVDGALGPVHPFFERQPPVWLLKGKFCERPVLRTGTLLEWNQTRTGNVLLKRQVFDEKGLSFDLSMRTSSSDRAFFKKAIQAGYRFVAVEEAPVYEIVPPERWTRGYYLKRSLAHGFNSYINSSDELHGLSWAAMALKSAVAVLGYALILPPCIILRGHWIVKCLESGGYHLSRLCAMFGIKLIRKRDF
jgi:succinoglycan biosynthesis protein ExoM